MHAVGLAVKRWGGLLLILAMLSSVAVGQDATDAATDATPTPTPTPTPSAAEDATEPATDVWERLIYLPYRNLKDVFEKEGSTVFMPYAEYLKRWQHKPTVEDSKVVEAVITESHYSARVDKSLLRIDVELKVQVLGKPWVSVPMNFGKAAVGKLTAEDGKQVLLSGTGNGAYALLFGQAGEHVVKLELAVPIQTSPDGRSTGFEVPPVGVTTFELAIPEADQTVDVSPQLIDLPVEVAAGETRIKSNLGATTSISASWHPKTGLKPDMDLLAAVTNFQKVSLRDGLAHTDAWLTYDILRGEMTELLIAVPTGHRILGVTSGDAKIRGWKAAPDDAGQMVTVEFLSPVRNKVTIEVHTEREFGADPLDVAGKDSDGKYNGIHAVDAVRESGQISVVASSDLSLQFEQVTGLARIEEAEIAQQLRQAGAATFKFYSADIELRVLAKSVEARLLVDSSYSYEFTDDELKLSAGLNYTIERAGVFELKVELPADLEIDSVSDNQGLYREHHIEGDEPRVLRVVLQRKTAPNFQIGLQINGHLAFAEASEVVELSLPIPSPLNVEREVAQVYVVAPEAIDVITDQETVVAAQPLPVPAVQQPNGKRMAAAWSFNRRPVEIPLRTERRPTRLTATVGTTVEIKEEIVEVKSVLTYQVQFAGLDTFRFKVPEDVSGKLQIVSLEGPAAPAIKQKVPAEEAVDGWVVWTVTMQRDVVGSHRFQLSWDQTPGGEDPADELPAEGAAAEAAEPADAAAEKAEAKTSGGAQSSETVFQTVQVLGLDGTDEKQLEVALSNVTGEIVVLKDRSLSVSAKTLDDSLEAIDVRELTLLGQNGSLAYRYFRQPAALQLTATKHEIQKVVETVVIRGLVEVVARRDTKANYRCRYRIRSSERQRLRVDVPVGSELLGVFVDGNQVNPEKNSQPIEEAGWDSYFVNVARQGASDEPFSLTVQMLTPVAERAPFNSWGGKILLRLPQIGGINAAGVAVQQLNTLIWVPEDYRLVGDADGFINETRLLLGDALRIDTFENEDWFVGDDWIDVPSAGFIDFPTEGTRFRFTSLGGSESITVSFLNRPNYSWLFSGALLIIAVLLRGLSWDTKLLLLLITGFVATLFGLSHPGWSAEILAAAKYGLSALIAIWVLHSIFARKSHSTCESDAEDDSSTPPEAPERFHVDASLPVVIPPPGVFDDLRAQFGN